ncbi:MAG TPA: serine protease [Thermoanaerobaculia bacterium]|nr:serine protease [Thermoanaerobaculia bacterium]
MSSRSIVDSLVDATERYDRRAAEAHALALMQHARTADTVPEKDAKDALRSLRNKRYFDLLQQVADALIQAGQAAPSVRKLYAQALIDRGAITAATTFLQSMEKECRYHPTEYDEALALLGRAYKQSYVDGHGMSLTRRQGLLEKAVGHYYAVYRSNPRAFYQGINVVALLARASEDNVSVHGLPDSGEIAAAILTDIEKLKQPENWDYAVAAEASIALALSNDPAHAKRHWAAAVEWIDLYLQSGNTDAFEVASTLRQFTEVWRLDTRGDAARGIVEVLRSALLTREGGRIDVQASAPQETTAVDESMLQRVLGADRYQTLNWYRTGLDRSRAVARLGLDQTKGLGTGFLVHGEAFHASQAGRQLLITNAHVLSPNGAQTLHQDDAIVSFESLDGGQQAYTIAEILYSSPPDQLDATVALLDRPVDGVSLPPVAPALPTKASPTRLYVIGHPHGGTLSFSIDDNLLLDYDERFVHYRSPTDPGSSGSPVFNRIWSLVALHHAGGMDMRKLNNEPGTYPANEGIALKTIIQAFRESRGN